MYIKFKKTISIITVAILTSIIIIIEKMDCALVDCISNQTITKGYEHFSLFSHCCHSLTLKGLLMEYTKIIVLFIIIYGIVCLISKKEDLSLK
jgi:hypothetical protein